MKHTLTLAFIGFPTLLGLTAAPAFAQSAGCFRFQPVSYNDVSIEACNQCNTAQIMEKIGGPRWLFDPGECISVARRGEPLNFNQRPAR